jgi:hypothetical protein
MVKWFEEKSWREVARVEAEAGWRGLRQRKVGEVREA